MSARRVVPNPEAETLSLAEAAKVLGISRATAYTLVASGEFPVPVLKIGRLLKVARVQLDRYFAAGHVSSPVADASLFLARSELHRRNSSTPVRSEAVG